MMKLADWLEQKRENGKRIRRYEFAARVGVTPSMITDYCTGKSWPQRQTMEAIVRETGGNVTANDFLKIEAAE